MATAGQYIQKMWGWSSFFFLVKACFWTAILLGKSGDLHAQDYVPDSVSLSDIRFFSDKEAGSLFLQALDVPEDNIAERLRLLLPAYDHARVHLDWAAQGLTGTEIARIHLHNGDAAQAFDWVNRALSIDSLIPPLSPLRQRMHRDLGGIYSSFEAYKLALPHIRTALAIDKARDPWPTSRRYRHCSSLAIGFQKAGQMDSAFVYYQKAISIAEELKTPLWRSSARNNYGMALLAMGHYDSALAVFQEAYPILEQQREDEKEFAVSIRDNLGETLLKLGRPAEALPLYELNFADFSMRPNNPRGHIQAGLGIVKALVAMNRGREAKERLVQVNAFAASVRKGAKESLYRDILETGILVAQMNGDWQEASRVQGQLLHYQDSTRSTALQVKVGTLQDMLLDKTAHFNTELELTRQSAANARARAQVQTLLILSMALLSIMLLLVILVNYRRRVERAKTRHQAETFRRELAELGLKNERLENSQLNQQLEMKQRDITDYALVYSQRRKIFAEILEDLKQIKRSSNPEKSLQELIIALKGKKDGEGKLHLEATHIEQVNHAFFDKLKQSYPSLGANELELCGMIRLGYSAKDIAAIRNIAPASVRIAKTRLKKKMALGPEVSLEAFLGNQ